MKRPLVYYSISFFLGCIFALMISLKSSFLGVAVAASFFIMMYFTIEKKFLFLILLFFFSGVVSFNIYFHCDIPKNASVRVIEKNYYGVIGNYRGRKFLFKGDVKNLTEGKLIEMQGQFKRVPNFEKGIIGSFDIKKYYYKKEDFIYNLYNMKKVIYERLKKPLGQEKTAMVMALCYGDTRYLSKEQKNDFQKMGVVHAVSVSGFHMAIIYKALEKVMGLKLAIGVSFLYLLFTGLQAATIRSFIMILILKLAFVFFKDYDGISSLSMAALIILFLKPYYVLDLGFMLSFSATLGIIIYYKKINLLLYRMPKFLNETLSVSLSSQIFSMPYIAFTIQNFSCGFIIGNMVLLPLYSIIVILGNLLIVFINVNFVFDLFCKLLKLSMNSIEGANYYILKCCPNITSFGYFEGSCLVILYFSYLMYKYKNKRFKYAPLFILIIFLIRNYTFIPQIYHVNLDKGEAVVIKYHNQNTMVCNYETESVKELWALKEELKINKMITNPKSMVGFKLKPHTFGNVYLMEKERKSSMDVFCGKNKVTMNFQHSNKMQGEDIKKQTLYVIIFNRVIRMN